MAANQKRLERVKKDSIDVKHCTYYNVYKLTTKLKKKKNYILSHTVYFYETIHDKL